MMQLESTTDVLTLYSFIKNGLTRARNDHEKRFYARKYPKT
jgi:hypothetical protein